MEGKSKRCLEKNEKKTCDKKKKTNCAGINNPFYLTQAVSEVETESYNLRFAFSEKIHEKLVDKHSKKDVEGKQLNKEEKNTSEKEEENESHKN